MAEFVDEREEHREFKEKHLQKGIFFKNMKTYPAVQRPLRGTAGIHFELANNKTIQPHISEIPALGSSKRHRHMNEAILYIVCGRGYTVIQEEGKEPARYDWEEGDLFSPPLNAWHQHFNTDPERPARYLAVTNVVLMQSLGLFTKEQFRG